MSARRWCRCCRNATPNPSPLLSWCRYRIASLSGLGSTKAKMVHSLARMVEAYVATPCLYSHTLRLFKQRYCKEADEFKKFAGMSDAERRACMSPEVRPLPCWVCCRATCLRMRQCAATRTHTHHLGGVACIGCVALLCCPAGGARYESVRLCRLCG